MPQSESMSIAADIVRAHLSTTPVRTIDLTALIRNVHGVVVELSEASPPGVVRPASGPESPSFMVERPADAPQPIEASRPQISDPVQRDVAEGYVRNGTRTLYDDHFVCLEDGRDVVLLTRHLKRLGISPDDYRRKWGLPSSYPMVTPDYSATKREIAIRTRFGRSDRTSRAKHGRRDGTLSPAYSS